MQGKKEANAGVVASDDALVSSLSSVADEKRQPSEKPLAVASEELQGEQDLILHGPRLWLLLGGLYLGIYLLALESTMLSTVIPTLTNEFRTIADISWYETAYVLPV
jgi:hypothetical protein